MQQPLATLPVQHEGRRPRKGALHASHGAPRGRIERFLPTSSKAWITAGAPMRLSDQHASTGAPLPSSR